MRKLNNLFLTICLIFNLFSCVNRNCNILKLSDSDKEWFKPYESKNSNFVFASNKSNIDTLELDSKLTFDLTPCNKFELGEYQFERGIVRLKSKNFKAQPSYCHNIDLLLKRKKDESIITFDIFNLSETYKFIDLKNIKIDTLSVDSLNLIYVALHFEAEKNIKKGCPKSDLQLKSFRWSKSEGLVSFEFEDGEEFILIDKF